MSQSSDQSREMRKLHTNNFKMEAIKFAEG